MKRVSALFLSFIFLICSASAHPGRTDSSGGHHVSATGEYHYHHGYPAHEHKNGICPYDYVDKTGSSSGSTTSKKEESKSEIIETKEEPNKENKSSVFDFALICLIFVVFVAPFLFFLYGCIALIIDIIKGKKEKPDSKPNDTYSGNELGAYWFTAPDGRKIYADDPKELQDKIKEFTDYEAVEETEQEMFTAPARKNKKIANVVLMFLIIASLCVSTFFAIKTNRAVQTLEAQAEEQNNTIDKQKEAISALNKQYVSAAVENHDLSDEVETLEAKNNELVKALIEADMERSFWHEYAVIVTSTGSKYHTYDCQHVDGKKFWIYNIDAAKSKGYSPCLDCDPPQ